MATNYRKNVSIVSRLLIAEEAKGQKRAHQALVERVGVPAEVLSPVSNATRQLDQDVATASAITGIPAPPAIHASDTDNPVQLGPNDDPPVSSYQPGQGTMVNGMRRPEDRRGTIGMIPGTPGQQPPATATQELPPESNATRQLDQDVQLAKNIGGWPRFESLDGLSDKDVIEAFVESVGGVDRATFLLISDGCPLALAELIVAGKLSQVNEAVREKLSKIFEGDIHQKANSPNASPGFKKWYADRVKGGSSSGPSKPDFKPNNGPNRDKPSAGWSSTKNAGHDARKNK